MKPSRVVLCDLPPLARDLVHRAFSEADNMTVVAQVGQATLRQAVREFHADCVVAGVSDKPPRSILHLLAEFPDLRLIMLRPDGRSASVFILQRTILIGFAPQDLPRAIRNTVTGTGSSAAS